MIFDSHAHYDSHQFDDDRHQVLSTFLPRQDVVGVINCGSDFPSSEFSLQLAEQYDYIYAAVGVHPHEAAESGTWDANRLKQLASHPKCVAIGEIGLDYHYDFSPRDLQKEWFENQIVLANEMGKPIVVHDREAHADTWELLRAHKPAGVVHCFSGSVQMMQELVSMGFYISFAGPVTFKNGKKAKEVAALVPLDRILIETDSPYLTPEPHRGERNDSSMVRFVCQELAQIRGLSEAEMAQITMENGKRFFGI